MKKYILLLIIPLLFSCGQSEKKSVSGDKKWTKKEKEKFKQLFCYGFVYSDSSGEAPPPPDPSAAEVFGCTDGMACNYNYLATDDDGSCEFPELGYDCNGDSLKMVMIYTQNECDCMLNKFMGKFSSFDEFEKAMEEKNERDMPDGLDTCVE